MPRRCSICSHPSAEALHTVIRPGISFRELAELFGFSRSAVYRHVRGKHGDPDSLLRPKPPGARSGCGICQMGPEIRELVLQARRAEKSVRHLAVKAQEVVHPG